MSFFFRRNHNSCSYAALIVSKIDELYCSNTTDFTLLFKLKDLIIGNNAYKLFYLDETIQQHFLSILSDFISKCEENSQINRFTTNLTSNLNKLKQVAIIYTSFSLGHIVHVTKLISEYKLHLIMMKLVTYLYHIKQHQPTSDISLLEICVRCLCNLYITAQLNETLLIQLDNALFDNEQSSDILGSLMFASSLSLNLHQSVISIFSISIIYSSHNNESINLK